MNATTSTLDQLELTEDILHTILRELDRRDQALSEGCVDGDPEITLELVRPVHDAIRWAKTMMHRIHAERVADES
jgi:hypothetical protein